MNKIINGNVIRALHRLRANPNDVEHLVEDEYHEEVLNLINAIPVDDSDTTFDLNTEFITQYTMIKSAMKSIGTIDSKEDLDVMKEAQKFLTFILRNEEKLNDISAVKEFKEAVLFALDQESPELKDRVIRSLTNG